MAVSKLIQSNRKIQTHVITGFQRINNTVASKYTQIEDSFVDAFLTREGESVADAKSRLKEETSHT